MTTETGEPFTATAPDDPGERYVLLPVLLYGRAAGGRVVLAPWSRWEYRVQGRPDVRVDPRPRGAGDRPAWFLLDFGRGVTRPVTSVFRPGPPPRLHAAESAAGSAAETTRRRLK